MLDAQIYNEIRKIDNRPVLTTPTPGSLADLIKNSGDKPFTNFVRFETTSTTYVQALSVTGKGLVLVNGKNAGTNMDVKIIVDGVIIEYDIVSSKNALQNFGVFKFNSSLEIQALSRSSSYATILYLSYTVE